MIKDLLPLYVDECCSEESTKLVAEHLDNCESCRKFYNQMCETCQVHEEKPNSVKLHRVSDWKASVLQSLIDQPLDGYRVICVPFVDYEGVIRGDQGKSRVPHDHNRDYNERPLYPEVAAIQKLLGSKEIFFMLDMRTDFFHILIVETNNQQRNFIISSCQINSLKKHLANTW